MIKFIRCCLLTFALLLGFISNSVAYSYETERIIQRVKITFTSPSGNVRNLLLGFTSDNSASDGVDYAFDSKNRNNYENDLSWIIENERFIIQGVGEFNDSKHFQLGLWLAELGSIKIDLKSLENFDIDIPVFLYDKEVGDYTPLNEAPFIRNVEPGIYKNRFYLAFKNHNLEKDPVITDNPKDTDKSIVDVKFNNSSQSLVFSTPDLKLINEINLFSLDNKLLYSSQQVNKNSLTIPSNSMNGQVIIARIKVENGLFKKAIIIPK